MSNPLHDTIDTMLDRRTQLETELARINLQLAEASSRLLAALSGVHVATPREEETTTNPIPEPQPKTPRRGMRAQTEKRRARIMDILTDAYSAGGDAAWVTSKTILDLTGVEKNKCWRDMRALIATAEVQTISDPRRNRRRQPALYALAGALLPSYAQPPPDPLTDDETDVLGALNGEPRSLHHIYKRTNIPLVQLQGHLQTLVERGHAAQVDDNNWRRNT